MLPILTSVKSSVGKKIIMAVTALSLILFVIVHLIGNLALLNGNADSFNNYAHKLESFGVLLYVAEIGLIILFLTHFVIAVSIMISKREARPIGYYMKRGLGKPSRQSIGSSTMIYTGIIMLIFIILHLIHFKYGPGIKEGYIKVVDGEVVRDLYRLVVDSFKNVWYVSSYTGVMVLLGIHLSHGFWSAFQSLGAHHRRYTSFIYGVGIFVALLLSIGFLSIPVLIYFG
ncbi:MAG: succinate dehydrogenase cytochrome b subunit [Candidatus Anammoxibacter sp.]